MNDAKNKVFSSFTPAFLSATYSLTKKEISVTTEWVKRFKLDYTTSANMMVVEGNTFRHKKSGGVRDNSYKDPIQIDSADVQQDLWQS